MKGIAKHRRVRRKQHNEDVRPKSIIEIIQTQYPERYEQGYQTGSWWDNLFSAEEWLDILLQARTAHEGILEIDKIKKPR